MCRCNKEKEISEMHTDIKWIKKALEGNGKAGLIERVRDNERWRYVMTGAITLFGILLSYGMLEMKGII